jgi:hypothetical protein
MITSKQCFDKFGEPTPAFERKWMVLWDVPDDINKAIPALPNKIYCNKLMVLPLENAFRCLIQRGKHKELKTWDGCFNIRKKRGLSSMSLHSWGIAIDVNAAWNQLGKQPTLSKEFVKCFTDQAFEWGGTWTRKDGMHFQLSII